MKEITGTTLALDCATTTGYAIGTLHGIPLFGEIVLKNGEIDLYTFLENVTAEYNITRIVAEDFFFSKYQSAAKRLGNYHGVIRLFCQQHNIELILYPPTKWKRVITMQSYASKECVLNRVRHLVSGEIASDNVSDAIGIFYAWRKEHRRKFSA